MKRALRALILSAVEIALTFGQSSDSYVESKIVAMEGLKCQAYRAKDLGTLDRMLDIHFVSVDQNSEANSKANVLVMLRETDSLRLTIQQVVVRLHRDTAIATGLYELHGTRHGKGWAQHGRFVDTWLARDGQWKLIASLATPAE